VKEQAPPIFFVDFKTTKGDFQVECTREWAPLGVDRFYNLVKIGYFDDTAFYRALEDYIVQFGTHGDPKVTQIWSTSVIGDDPVLAPNNRGYLTFAQEAPNTRTTQLFINLTDNSQELDPYGLAPICLVNAGMDVVDSVFIGYGEMHPKGDGPRPNLLQKLGNKYLRREFPDMDYIITATVVE
jgi:peptidyl-prolyl cis-trans isomerase A (cyclophilin A)